MAVVAVARIELCHCSTAYETTMFSRHSLLKPFCLRNGRVRILISTFWLGLVDRRGPPLVHAVIDEAD